MKKLLVLALTFCCLGVFAYPVLAAQDTATATVSATVASITSVELDRDTNSVTRGSANQVLFDKRDDEDMTGGDAGYMYAPYRSETGKNWHVAEISANGSTMSLDVSATLTGRSDVSKLKLWCGGFFATGATTAITGTPSTDWEIANGWQRSLSSTFVGTVPFSYQLNIGDVPAGTYAGNITLTLTSN